MKATTLIKLLQYAVSEIGDVEVLVEKEDYSGYKPISSSMCINSIAYQGFDGYSKIAEHALALEI